MTVRVVAVLVLLLSLAGCSNDSSTMPPMGVDELTIPTPGPDPDDFVATVDNSWLPLDVDRAWTYLVADAAGTHPMLVSAAVGPEIAGVATTARIATEGEDTVTDYLAQDDDGNVWWFGREGEWVAGTDGAEAGLLMAASPRVGDGYLMGGGDQATVEAVEEDAVRLRVRTAEATTSERTYAPDVGLVEQTDALRTIRLAD